MKDSTFEAKVIKDIEISSKCTICCLCCPKWDKVKDQKKNCIPLKARSRLYDREFRMNKRIKELYKID